MTTATETTKFSDLLRLVKDLALTEGEVRDLDGRAQEKKSERQAIARDVILTAHGNLSEVAEEEYKRIMVDISEDAKKEPSERAWWHVHNAPDPKEKARERAEQYAQNTVNRERQKLRAEMISRGVAKGTASKINTVLAALYEGKIMPSDVRSLSSAYASVKALEKVAREAAAAAASSGAASPATATAPTLIAPPTPDEALDIILESIRTAGGGAEDAVFRAAGDWIDKITSAISDLTRNLGDDDE